MKETKLDLYNFPVK